MACLGVACPRYILADEPTSALDEENQDHLLTLLREIYPPPASCSYHTMYRLRKCSAERQ